MITSVRFSFFNQPVRRKVITGDGFRHTAAPAFAIAYRRTRQLLVIPNFITMTDSLPVKVMVMKAYRAPARFYAFLRRGVYDQLGEKRSFNMPASIKSNMIYKLAYPRIDLGFRNGCWAKSIH